eukprot:CAMPEP_0176345774 /NCGR_PEP_ID=MMETSP0126-20121128/5730_1 /TAXON_ID=141414 ORGANISM="Strombidinopsis acuminatum, Strain SPMC142" /NCGR_SAMPLE_ID=MMETSP0126 /ASSEMBLY_ACC=CAM_ASM_000229 /LENGTH=54 /DNA_ID=CAMNT_0017692959 /DNA_START=446 /DNA_END=610 /DNA_ORIENTATION=+
MINQSKDENHEEQDEEEEEARSLGESKNEVTSYLSDEEEQDTNTITESHLLDQQ